MGAGRSVANYRLGAENLLAWLGEVLAAWDGGDVSIIIEEGAGACSRIQIILNGVPSPLAGIMLRQIEPG